jgi:hypothetical protein
MPTANTAGGKMSAANVASAKVSAAMRSRHRTGTRDRCAERDRRREREKFVSHEILLLSPNQHLQAM